MPTFAFWNVFKKGRMCTGNDPSMLVALALEHDVDVFITAENSLPTSQIILALNEKARPSYRPDPQQISSTFKIVTRYTDDRVDALVDGPHFAIRQYRPPIGDSITVVAVHLASKLFHSSYSQARAAAEVVQEIERVEEELGHARSLVIGDFNMDPFEDGLIAAGAFHAQADRRIAAKRSRRIGKQSYRFFFNPMWSHFGDTSEPPGTYFRADSTYDSRYWRMLDQVLLRPDLLPKLTEHVKILTAIDGVALTTSGGRPKKRNFSDHLPIVLKLKDLPERKNHERSMGKYRRTSTAKNSEINLA